MASQNLYVVRHTDKDCPKFLSLMNPHTQWVTHEFACDEKYESVGHTGSDKMAIDIVVWLLITFASSRPPTATCVDFIRAS